MPANASYAVRFRKAKNPDLPMLVRIRQNSKKPEEGEHAMRTEYTVYWDGDWRFQDGTEIDAHTFLVWDRLSQPVKLNVPFASNLPWERRSATFADESV